VRAGMVWMVLVTPRKPRQEGVPRACGGVQEHSCAPARLAKPPLAPYARETGGVSRRPVLGHSCAPVHRHDMTSKDPRGRHNLSFVLK
jgi:hypothetical protein